MDHHAPRCGPDRRIAATITRKLMARTFDPIPRRAQGGAMHRLVRFLLTLTLLWPLDAVAQVQPHRAEYALRLGAATDAPRIGTAVYDLTQDCAGWHVKRDIRVDIALTASWRISLSSKMQGDETRDAFRFSTVQTQNGGQREMKGKVERRAGEMQADISFAEGPSDQFTLPAATLLPVQAIGYLIEQLKAKAGSFPALMFDAEVIGDTFLVEVTRQDPAEMRPARLPDRPVALPSGRSWPISMTFTRGRRQDQLPLFRVDTLVFDNGVFDRLTIATGLVDVTADLQGLEMHPVPACPRT
jgi:hypothetical protein